MKSLVIMGTFTPVFVCSCASPVIPLSEFYLPFPFYLLSVRFHHFESEASRGYPMSEGVVQRHHFSSSSGKSSSPLPVLIVRFQNHKSNTLFLSPIIYFLLSSIHSFSLFPSYPIHRSLITISLFSLQVILHLLLSLYHVYLLSRILHLRKSSQYSTLRHLILTHTLLPCCRIVVYTAILLIIHFIPPPSLFSLSPSLFHSK